MENTKEAISKGLLKAMKAEREGQSFYMMAANSTDDPKGKEVFSQLAKDEHDHLLYLKKQYETLQETGKVDPNLKLGEKTRYAGTAPIFSENFKSRIKDRHYEMSALSIGIQLELDAIKYYKSQADDFDDPTVREFYTALADWEKEHYDALNNQYEFLKEDYWSESGFSPF